MAISVISAISGKVFVFLRYTDFRMPQLPDLIHLAIPGFILLLLLEATADAVMRRELYELKDTAAS
ncbi:MAG TPA: hypothetical protein VN669_03815, partial [Candidatus Acidoferrales bacterium]|nr:hypothetical protein [Candidatus Acidoferrales bacterium]